MTKNDTTTATVYWVEGNGVRLALSSHTHVTVGEAYSIPSGRGFRAYVYAPVSGGPRYFDTAAEAEAWVAERYAAARRVIAYQD